MIIATKALFFEKDFAITSKSKTDEIVKINVKYIDIAVVDVPKNFTTGDKNTANQYIWENV